jgi:hypothetical protein
MPGMITVSQQETFATPPLVMSVGPRMKFGTDQQDVTRDGQRKWSVQVAVGYFADYGMRPVAEVIEVGLVGEDPSHAVQAGGPVSFDRLRCGIQPPERRDDGKGGTKISGGRLYWSADAVRPFSGNGNGRPVPAAAKAE